MSEADARRRLGTAEYFGRLAESYGSGEYYRKRREAVIAEVRRALGARGRLLDLGCGDGRYLAEFAKLPGCGFIAGADLSLEMLCEARRRLDHERSPALACCDAMALPFRSGIWDAVFCSHVLQIVDDVRQCLSEIVRCLAPRGMLIVAGGPLGALRQMDGLIGTHWSSGLRRMVSRAARARRSLGPGDLRRACESLGLSVQIKELSFTATGADLAEGYRVRRLPLMERGEREAAERILAKIEREHGATQVELTETLLFGSRASV